MLFESGFHVGGKKRHAVQRSLRDFGFGGKVLVRRFGVLFRQNVTEVFGEARLQSWGGSSFDQSSFDAYYEAVLVVGGTAARGRERTCNKRANDNDPW
jgi:hypothetical protein